MDSSMMTMQTISNFGFSGTNIDDLGASEYTLASVVCDVSGSVVAFKNELRKCLKTILGSCTNNPRAENTMLRLVEFADSVQEIHGFRPISEIDQSEYDNAVKIHGCTALYDAVLSALEATCQYAEVLNSQDYDANAVIYVLTDGMDNQSSSGPAAIKKALRDARKSECLESIAVILIEVGTADPHVMTYLNDLKTQADLDQFIDISDLFAKTNPEKAMAKLAGFISKSISSTSQALVNGSSSPTSSLLTF